MPDTPSNTDEAKGRIKEATGKGVAKASRTIGSATTATLSLKLSKGTRSALAHGKNVKIKVTVLFTPKGAKKAKRTTKTLLIHGSH